MAEQRSTHLRVVRPTVTAAPDPQASREASRASYWAQVQSLRDERRQLRTG